MSQSIPPRLILRLLLVLATWAATGLNPCAGQPMRYTTRSVYHYNAFAQLTGMTMSIDLGVRQWLFTLDRSFLALPVPVQVNVLDRRFGLGADRVVVARVMQDLRQQRQEDERRQTFERMQQDLQRQQETMRRDMSELNRQQLWQRQQEAMRRDMSELNRQQLWQRQQNDMRRHSEDLNRQLQQDNMRRQMERSFAPPPLRPPPPPPPPPPRIR